MISTGTKNIAAQLRDTYRELSMVAQSRLSSPTYGLVDKFLFNAESADDSTLCELEATYHASREI